MVVFLTVMLLFLPLLWFVLTLVGLPTALLTVEKGVWSLWGCLCYGGRCCLQCLSSTRCPCNLLHATRASVNILNKHTTTIAVVSVAFFSSAHSAHCARAPSKNDALLPPLETAFTLPSPIGR